MFVTCWVRGVWPNRVRLVWNLCFSWNNLFSCIIVSCFLCEGALKTSAFLFFINKNQAVKSWKDFKHTMLVSWLKQPQEVFSESQKKACTIKKELLNASQKNRGCNHRKCHLRGWRGSDLEKPWNVRNSEEQEGLLTGLKAKRDEKQTQAAPASFW